MKLAYLLCTCVLATAGVPDIFLVTIDTLIGDRLVSGMKIDVEGFEVEVLRGAVRALADHRIELIQIEWNEMSRVSLGADRRPIAELLADHGYRLSEQLLLHVQYRAHRY